MPLAERFAGLGYRVSLSTTSAGRLAELEAVPAEAFLVDIGGPLDDIDAFLRSDILVVNITSKDIEGFGRLVQEIETSEVESVLFVSSTSVYANDSGVVDEEPGNEIPDHPLVVIENLFREAAGFRTTVVRFAGLIGANRHPGRFFRGGKIVRNPDAGVNLIHLDDCLEILETIVVEGLWDEVFNACADSHPSKREFYSHAAALAGAAPPEFGDNDDSGGKIVDNRKLKKALGYEFRYPDPMAIRFDKNRV